MLITYIGTLPSGTVRVDVGEIHFTRDVPVQVDDEVGEKLLKHDPPDWAETKEKADK